jgi:RNA polymerase-binding transcription factor DksA
MVITIPRFAPSTTTALVGLLLDRRASIERRVDALRREAVDAFSRRDLSDMYDQEDPTTDSDGAVVLLLVERAERRLREVEQALARMDGGTYGYCTVCGRGIPLERLRALPAAATCVTCSDRSSHRARTRVGPDRKTTDRAGRRSPLVGGTSGPAVGR